jgi:hypothetical protein
MLLIYRAHPQCVDVEHVALFVVCVLHDHSITTDPYCAPCVLRTPANALHITLINNTVEKYVTPFDGDVCLEIKAVRAYGL